MKPTRPSRDKSPSPKTPSTSAEKTSGSTTISTSRRKTRPNGSATWIAHHSSVSWIPFPLASIAATFAASAGTRNDRLQAMPSAAPTSRPSKILVWSAMPRSVLSAVIVSGIEFFSHQNRQPWQVV